jgi:prepilin-type N-terminal cleavage/methylation domain-containing protein
MEVDRTVRRTDRESGFTLLELMVSVVIGSAIMSIALWGMHNYLLASRHSGTATDIRSGLRNVAEQALSEGRTYCVYFTNTQWTTYRSDCTISANKTSGPVKVQDPSITLPTVAFPAPATAIPGQNTACPQAGRCAYFYPRGTALAGSVQVVRPNKTYTINVEGLTARVSLG